MILPAPFFDRPFAHRALHDKSKGRPENSVEAINAAIAAGYGIEIDVQPSKDGFAVVFHDYDMTRLAGIKGPIATRLKSELSEITPTGGESGIPTLQEALALIAGRVPILIEVKDQDGAMGPNVGALEQAVSDALQDYHGDVALMSFNPHSVAALKLMCPNRPRGLVTCAYTQEDWPTLSYATRNRLATIPDFDNVSASFISHDRADLENEAVTALKSRGIPIFTWTVKSHEQEKVARRIVDNITFEQYLA